MLKRIGAHHSTTTAELHSGC